MENVSRMKELISRLNQAAKVYYQGQGEVMSNFEYDKLYDELLALEKETGITITAQPFMSDMKPLVNFQKSSMFSQCFL